MRIRSVLPLIFLFLLAARTAAAGLVAGRVVDPDGRPVPHARVWIGAAGTSLQTATDASGRFELRVPDDCRCELRVWMEGFRAQPVTIDATAAARDVGTLTLEISAVSESLVVSAAQVEIPLSQASASVTIITGDELRARQLSTVAEALHDVPGLAENQSGGRGALTSVFPRGGESDYTLVYLDDVQLNAFGGAMDFAHLSTANIERIEVVRGPQSALYGSNGIGAVVRIVTRSGGPIRGDASIEGGSFSSRRAAASTSGSAGAWSWGAGVEHLSSDGFNGTTLATGEQVTNDDYERSGAGANGGWRAANGTSIDGSVRFERDARGFPGPFGSNPIGAFEHIDAISRGRDDRWIGSIAGSVPSGARVRTHAQATWNTLDGRFESPFGPSTSTSRRWTARAQSDVALRPGLDLSAGLEVQRERATSTFITNDAFAEIPVKRWTAGYFGEARWTTNERLFVTGGLRVEDIRRDALAGFADPFSPRPPFPSDRVVSTNPRVAAAWFVRPDAGESTKVRVAAGTGIRPPDAFEIAFTDNPSLKPERSRSIEAGVDQAFASGHALVELTAFRNTFDDLIVAVGRFEQSSRYRTDNISNARARGLELEADARPTRAITIADLDLAAADFGRAQRWLDRIAPPLGSIVSGGVTRTYAVGDPLTRRPRHAGAVHATYVRGRVTAFGEVTSRGRTLDVEPNFGASGGLFFAPGYALVNAGTSVRLAPHIQIYARVQNLADRHYEEALGFPRLRRSGIAGVRIASSR